MELVKTNGAGLASDRPLLSLWSLATERQTSLWSRAVICALEEPTFQPIELHPEAQPMIEQANVRQ